MSIFISSFIYTYIYIYNIYLYTCPSTEMDEKQVDEHPPLERHKRGVLQGGN